MSDVTRWISVEIKNHVLRNMVDILENENMSTAARWICRCARFNLESWYPTLRACLMNHEPVVSISTQTASMLTGKSTKTLYRWVDSGAIPATQTDDLQQGVVGGKLLFDLRILAQHIPTELTDDFIEAVLRAEAGKADGMNEVGLFFYGARQYGIAIGWFEAAAKKGHLNAMDWLSDCTINGLGVEKNDAKAIQWLGKAAEHGHLIAKAKLAILQPQMEVRPRR